MQPRASNVPEAQRTLAADVVSLTALPSRWSGASPERIADDVAASLSHLCPDVDQVEVRLLLPPAPDVVAVRSRGGSAAEAARPAGNVLVAAARPVVAPIGRFGRHGEIRVAIAPGGDADHPRLLATIAANQVDAACRALDLERDVAQAHAKVAALAMLGALGQLVGGVAHEIRTPLTYAANYLHVIRFALLKRHPAAAAEVQPSLAEIQSALDRINDIVTQLRRFTRQSVEPRLEEDLRSPVRDAVRLWRATNVAGATVQEHLAPTPPVRVDRGQIQQVVINLLQNASDATGARGRVVVRTGEVDADAVLVVEDDGPGIAPEIERTLFEAFKTTKSDGLGLGLSIVRSIVEAHHGSIRITSPPEGGARVEVRIPRAGPAGGTSD